MSASALNSNFRPVEQPGKWLIQLTRMAASVVMAQGAAVYRVENGTHTIVTGSTANFKGILLVPITAADADYAVSGKLKPVAVPTGADSRCEFTVGAGTFTSADIGKGVVFNDSISLAVDTDGTQAVITEYLSATRGTCVFNLAIS